MKRISISLYRGFYVKTNYIDMMDKDKTHIGPKKKVKSFLVFQKELFLRLFMGFVAMLSIALFIHFKEIKVATLELNVTAAKYVVAQVDFEFPDEEATIILRQDAISDIGPIYRIEGKELRQVRFDFENYLIHHPEWRKEVPSSSYEEMYKIADALETILTEARFANNATIKKIQKFNLPVIHYLSFSPKEDEEKVTLPKEYWRHLKEVTFQKILESKFQDVPGNTLEFVINFFEQREWLLIKDFSSQKALIDLIQKSVPYRYQQVKKGTSIISQGEKVKSRHIAMVQAMKDVMRKNRNLLTYNKIFGDLLLSFIFVFTCAVFLYMNQRKVLKSLQALSLLVCILIITLAYAKIVEYILLQGAPNLADIIRFPVLIPFAAVLFTILINRRIATVLCFFLTVILSISLAVDHSKFLVINLVTMLIAIMAAKRVHKRTEVFFIFGKCFLGAAVVIIAYNLEAGTLFSRHLYYDLFSSALFLALTSIIVLGVLPMLESMFNVMTDITLMEYMDPNNELLRRLTMEIPGTYHHSLVLGNIAEQAAQAIGANGLLCRVATLYHDIGKLNNPHYFTENQQTGVNIHQLLTPQESAQVIISHVKDGEMLAKKYRLPQAIIDIIKEHHGTTLVYYFYFKELELKGGHKEEVDESLFRYPGPKPQSKEAAIMMIADTVEAASRSLGDGDEETFRNLVDKLVDERAGDGQFDECNITYKDLKIVKEVMIKSLLASHHVRIKYPEQKK